MTAAWVADRIEQWETDRIIPYARNARTHSPEQVAQIAASIAEFGFTNPILAGSDGVIVAGHGRLAAAQKMGLAHVPVVVLDHLSPTQRRALVIADNRIAENAGWDEIMLGLELSSLQLDGFDMDLVGFDEDELDRLLNGADDGDATEGLTDPDDVPDERPEAISKPGDIWLLGRHRLMAGDSTRIDDVNRLMGGEMAVMLLTDPPYNVAYEGCTKDKLTIQNDSMNDASFRQFLVDAFSGANAVMVPGATFYIWHSDLEAYNFLGACRDIGWKVRQSLIWVKNALVLGLKDYHCRHEQVIYGWKEGAGHSWYSDRSQTTVLEFDKPRRNGDHPTMKPVALFEYLLLNNTERGDVVLDLFGGSGTTLICAEKNHRISRVMELDTKYADVIVRRWQQFTGKTAILESTGDAFPG